MDAHLQPDFGLETGPHRVVYVAEELSYIIYHISYIMSNLHMLTVSGQETPIVYHADGVLVTVTYV